MFGRINLSLVLMLTLGIFSISAAVTKLKLSQGLGPEHCTKCGNVTDDVTEKEGLMGNDISSCTLIDGISGNASQSVFECLCKPGFIGTYKGAASDGISCFNIDECAAGTDYCDNFADCTDTPGNFTCQCIDGYRDNVGTLGDQYIVGTDCKEINECTEDKTLCNANKSWGVCENTAGSYYCECGRGFTNMTSNGPSRACNDINECDTSNHTCNQPHEHCVNTDGDYVCECDFGYQNQKGSCASINECDDPTKHHCGVSSKTKCVELEGDKGGYECVCITGSNYNMKFGNYEGYKFTAGRNTTCEDKNECTSWWAYNCIDDNRSVCNNTQGGYDCICDEGYYLNSTSDTCEDIDECYGSNNCSSDATCTNLPGTYSCKCNQGYEGDGTACKNVDECSLPRSDLRADECHRYANCTDSVGGYSCTCIYGFVGDGRNCTEVENNLSSIIANHAATVLLRKKITLRREEERKNHLLIEREILLRRCARSNLGKARPKREMVELPARSDAEIDRILAQLKVEISKLELENYNIRVDCGVTVDDSAFV